MRRRIAVAIVTLALVGGAQVVVPAAAVGVVPCSPVVELCVTVDAGRTNGPAALRAQDFLNGIFEGAPNIDTSLVTALERQHWRNSIIQSYWDGSKGA